MRSVAAAIDADARGVDDDADHADGDAVVNRIKAEVVRRADACEIVSWKQGFTILPRNDGGLTLRLECIGGWITIAFDDVSLDVESERDAIDFLMLGLRGEMRVAHILRRGKVVGMQLERMNVDGSWAAVAGFEDRWLRFGQRYVIYRRNEPNHFARSF